MEGEIGQRMRAHQAKGAQPQSRPDDAPTAGAQQAQEFQQEGAHHQRGQGAADPAEFGQPFHIIVMRVIQATVDPQWHGTGAVGAASTFKGTQPVAPPGGIRQQAPADLGDVVTGGGIRTEAAEAAGGFVAHQGKRAQRQHTPEQQGQRHEATRAGLGHQKRQQHDQHPSPRGRKPRA